METSLNRTLSKFMVIFYGLGAILGAGIYVLVGKVAKYAGIYTPLAFLTAAIIALFTAVSYAELSARFPVSAGEAIYVEKAFSRKWLSMLTGWLVVFTGLISAATLCRGFVGYLQVFIVLPDWIIIITIIISMAAISILGIRLSASVIVIISLLEISGLLVVISLALNNPYDLYYVYHFSAPKIDMNVWIGIISGAFIAFYAFIGFEDMVNIAEEIKEPQKNLPAAIFWALGLATLFYILISVSIIGILPLEKITSSQAPFSDFLIQKGYSPYMMTVISLVAVINGALVQIIMASRVLYGMAKQGNAPKQLSKVHSYTQTPIYAILSVVTLLTVFALGFNIEVLARVTSSIILSIFIVVNLSLILIKYRIPKTTGPNYPILFPICGSLLSFMFLISQLLVYGVFR